MADFLRAKSQPGSRLSIVSAYFTICAYDALKAELDRINGLHLDVLNWGAYDLVVIDESHNFRNNKLATQRPGDTAEHRSRYQRLIEDIISAGAKTKVLLLSATPVNNQLADLRNQISFIAGGDVARDEAADAAFAPKLEIPSVKETNRRHHARPCSGHPGLRPVSCGPVGQHRTGRRQLAHRAGDCRGTAARRKQSGVREKIIPKPAADLKRKGRVGYGELTLNLCRQFYLAYPALPGYQILYALRKESPGSGELGRIVYALRNKSEAAESLPPSP